MEEKTKEEIRKERQKELFKLWAKDHVRNLTFSINFVREPELYELVFVTHAENKAEFIRECLREHLRNISKNNGRINNVN